MSFPPKVTIKTSVLVGIYVKGLVINFAGMSLYYSEFPLHMGHSECLTWLNPTDLSLS